MIDKLPTITFLNFYEQNEQKFDFTISVFVTFIHYNLRVENFPARLSSICSLRVKSLEPNLGCFDYTRKIFEAPTLTVRSVNASFGPDAASITANSERGESVGPLSKT